MYKILFYNCQQWGIEKLHVDLQRFEIQGIIEKKLFQFNEIRIKKLLIGSYTYDVGFWAGR